MDTYTLTKDELENILLDLEVAQDQVGNGHSRDAYVTLEAVYSNLRDLTGHRWG